MDQNEVARPEGALTSREPCRLASGQPECWLLCGACHLEHGDEYVEARMSLGVSGTWVPGQRMPGDDRPARRPEDDSRRLAREISRQADRDDERLAIREAWAELPAAADPSGIPSST